MLIRKMKAWSFLLRMGVAMFFLTGACAAPVSIIPTPLTYIPPTPSGPINIQNGIIAVEPKLVDDYLPNPGIGWQTSPETSAGLGIPESVAYANRHEIAWSILNPAEDVYDWSPLNQLLQAAVAAGKQFSFRVYTMVGEGYGGAMVPEWVLAKGAILLPSGEPDYSNCVYQEKWGKFVGELTRLYDGNPHIAFIDISGYGNFNEWSWQDQQTQWDTTWQNKYQSALTSPDSFQTLDGQARRRLADMFIGGAFDRHECRSANGGTVLVRYSYLGFQKTQLVMPYAGIIQSSQYVRSRRSDVGFRYDCLGRSGERVLEKIGNVVRNVWKTAPVVFELCKPNLVEIDDAKFLLQQGHGSIVHDNVWGYGADSLKGLLLNAGYRYFLKQASMKLEHQIVTLRLDWQNVGNAPSYPRMGQNFQLYFYLIDISGSIVLKEPIPANISQWLPSDQGTDEARIYPLSHVFELPSDFPGGAYFAGVSIVDINTGKPINLAFGGRDPSGWYLLFPLEVK